MNGNGTMPTEPEWKRSIEPEEALPLTVTYESYTQLAAIVVTMKGELDSLRQDVKSLREQTNFLCYVLEGIYRGLALVRLPDVRGWWAKLWHNAPTTLLQDRVLETTRELPEKIRAGQTFLITDWMKTIEVPDDEAMEASPET